MATLAPAVSSLRASLQLLDSSISILDEGVSDFPRLCKVLQTQQHFELVSETTLRTAQQNLADEIGPAIESLLGSAESYLRGLERKEGALKARSELLEGRMSMGAAGMKKKASHVAQKAKGGTGTEVDAMKMKRLQQKKDQLQFAIERLELQSKQKERELRKSMAFVRQEED